MENGSNRHARASEQEDDGAPRGGRSSGQEGNCNLAKTNPQGHSGRIISIAARQVPLSPGGTLIATDWQTLYRAAMTESEPAKLAGKIEAARRAVRNQLEELDDLHDSRERQQLNNALYALETLIARKRSA